ncbi:hypothetical protein IQ07DRAFT_648055 [Pyrenochaeta sp. DS3sAY3a]|nr:hypothetical protein IQ07DRAFT_648055 [Pyrenochaeta sp. DS3sAY3a]
MTELRSMAVIGSGSIIGIALLFAEVGVLVQLSDLSEKAMDTVSDKAKKAGYDA